MGYGFQSGRTNNRVLPNNARAVDVAKQAIEGIADVQQRRYLSAFQVSGYQGVLYQRQRQGRNCSCQGAQKIISTILDENGKASKGTINTLLTGKTFGIQDYGADAFKRDASEENEPFTVTAPFGQTSYDKYHGNAFDLATKGGVYGNEIVPNEPTNSDNGELPEFDLDQLMGDFDEVTLGSNDYACPICFGTGFIGGYIPTNATRQVVVPQDVEFMRNGYLDQSKRPFIAYGGFTTRVTLPRAVLHLDSLQLWNYDRKIGFQMLVDGVPISTVTHVLAFCDGKPHNLTIIPNSPVLNNSDEEPWTHFEIQFNTSSTSMWFEFPRITDGNDVTKLDQTEPFDIVLSPNIVQVSSEDIITDSTYGKHYIVQGTPIWNTRNRKTLGWETSVRVLQPAEPQRLLPVRGRIPTKNRTTVEVRDNMRGLYRT